MSAFAFSEKYLSQIPALRQLILMGCEYLSPEQAMKERGDRLSNVLLENVLRKQLKKINRIRFKDEEYRFSEENIQSAVQEIKNVPYSGLQKTNEKVYDLLTLGTTLQQTIEDETKSHTLIYVDWRTPANNVFHVTAEFSVERSQSAETVRPDVVLFVNGIPFVVMECKSPDHGAEEAVSQTIRNQGAEYAPRFFAYVQLLLAVNKNEAKYATIGTPKEFWSVWREQTDSESDIKSLLNKTLPSKDKDRLFSGDFARARPHFDALENEGDHPVTEQDRCLFSLCRPERLLEIVYGFMVFEAGDRKVARYHQFFLVRSALKRIKQIDSEGRRKGGIVWHTQGSGKSITMVMLVRALALDSELDGLRIVLVTDRKDLDKQLGNTFTACGLDKKRASSGRDLLRLIKEKTDVITTLVNKFDKALAAGKHVDDSPDIVALVDESHRTQFGSLAARMRTMLPKACYIGFTGTPLLKAEKNSFARFGGLIEPHYSVRQAVQDHAVVPLLYEGRQVEMRQDKAAIDLWFDRFTEGLSEEQKADLKRKYSRAQALNQADRVVYMRAFDVSRHFQANWHGMGFKAQLTAPSKAAALKYHSHLKNFGEVSSAVIISAPDTREGHEEVGAEPNTEVAQFWKRMMEKHGSEEAYNQDIINGFNQADDPKILIVVDKLITGFDAPRNTVLYLCRKLSGHTLLQAVARVNRLHEDKEFGYVIDYANVLGELNKALTAYDELSGFDEEDLADFLTSVNEQVSKLPQRRADLQAIFETVKNFRDEERCERLLADEKRRKDFYNRLSEYSRTLAIALSSEKFITENSQARLRAYKNDLKRFQKLKHAVQRRYAETIDYRDYQSRIKKLLDTHIQADEVTRLNEPVNVFDDKTFSMIKDKQGDYKSATTAARADTIAYAIQRSVNENRERDPAYYQKFSKFIQETIDKFKSERLSASEYLQTVMNIRDQLMNKEREDVPESIRGDDEACAYFGAVKLCLSETEMGESRRDEIAAETALLVKEAIRKNWKVDFWNDDNAQKSVKNEIDDFLYERVKGVHGIGLSESQMDKIIDETMQIAKKREAGQPSATAEKKAEKLPS